VLALFQQYLRVVRSNDTRSGFAGSAEGMDGEQLPADPTVLSHLVAATASLSLDDRQALLAEAETLSRLRAERAMLRREVGLLAQVQAIPVPLSEFAVPSSQN
jgi:hypothetical protein